MARSYYRAFITLEQEQKEYAKQGRESAGRCIVEARGKTGRITASVQYLKAETHYKLYLIAVSKSESHAVCAGMIHVDIKGKGEYRCEFDADNVFETEKSIEDFNTIAIIVPSKNDGGILCALAGYKDNIKQMWKNNWIEGKKIETPKKPPQTLPDKIDTIIEVEKTTECKPVLLKDSVETCILVDKTKTDDIELIEEVKDIELAEKSEIIELVEEIEDIELIKEVEDIELAEKPEIIELAEETEDIELIKEAEDIELTKEAEDIELAKDAEDIELAKEAEDIELAKEAEDIELIKEAEDIELAKEAEDIELAKEAEDIELAKEAEDIGLAEKAESIEETESTEEAKSKNIELEKEILQESFPLPNPHEVFRIMAKKFNEEMESLSNVAQDIDYNTKDDEVQHDTEVCYYEESETEVEYIEKGNQDTEEYTSYYDDSKWDEFERLFLENTVLHPFAKQRSHAKWIRTSPSELPLFPFGYQEYMNHPFITNAYKKYKHLIAGRLEYNGYIRYILGVPDVYASEYRPFAAELGFRQFKTCSGETGEGEYGYWLLIMPTE